MRYFVFLFFIATSLLASEAFISTLELKERLNDEKLLLLDLSTAPMYKTSHISNAVHVDLKTLLDAEDKIASLRELGLNNDSEVIIYARSTSQDQLHASYFALLLLSYGFDNVALLDGGYMAWVFENELLVSSEIFTKEEGNFESSVQRDFFITADQLHENLETVKLLDSRSPAEYFGSSLSKGVTGVGHIPGAQSSFYQDKFLSDFTLRPHEDLDQIFLDGHHLQKDDTIVVYGVDALQASTNWYILYKHFGFKDVKIYEGSMQEWGNNPELPLRKFLWECKK